MEHKNVPKYHLNYSSTFGLHNDQVEKKLHHYQSNSNNSNPNVNNSYLQGPNVNNSNTGNSTINTKNISDINLPLKRDDNKNENRFMQMQYNQPKPLNNSNSLKALKK